MQENCPECAKNGYRSKVKSFQINLGEAVWCCESNECDWPFLCESLPLFERIVGTMWSHEWDNYFPAEQSIKTAMITVPMELALYTPPETPYADVSLKESMSDMCNDSSNASVNSHNKIVIQKEIKCKNIIENFTNIMSLFNKDIKDDTIADNNTQLLMKFLEENFQNENRQVLLDYTVKHITNMVKESKESNITDCIVDFKDLIVNCNITSHKSFSLKHILSSIISSNNENNCHDPDAKTVCILENVYDISSTIRDPSNKKGINVESNGVMDYDRIAVNDCVSKANIKTTNSKLDKLSTSDNSCDVQISTSNLPCNYQSTIIEIEGLPPITLSYEAPILSNSISTVTKERVFSMVKCTPTSSSNLIKADDDIPAVECTSKDKIYGQSLGKAYTKFDFCALKKEKSDPRSVDDSEKKNCSLAGKSLLELGNSDNSGVKLDDPMGWVAWQEVEGKNSFKLEKSPESSSEVAKEVVEEVSMKVSTSPKETTSLENVNVVDCSLNLESILNDLMNESLAADKSKVDNILENISDSWIDSLLS